MTAKTRTDLKSKIDIDIADNTSGDIGAADVRENMKDSADSAVFPEDIPALLLGAQTGLLNPENEVKVSVNAGDPARFDISPGFPLFSDSYTDPSNPTETRVQFSGATNVGVTNIATSSATFLYIDSSGNIVQKTDPQDSEFLRDHVGIGILEHADNLTITNVSDFTPVAMPNSLMSFVDYSLAVGAINCASGDQNVVSGQLGGLGLNKSQGCWYYHAINVRNNAKSPNIIDSPALVTPTLLIGWRTNDNPNGKFIEQTTIPVNVYDDGSAVFSDSLPQGLLNNNNWANHRIFHVTDSNQLAVQIGQVEYGNLDIARKSAAGEVFEIIPVLSGATPIATLSMRGGAADLSSILDAEIRQAIPPRATFR